MRRAAVVALALLLPGLARAGGETVAVAPVGGTVWATAAPYVVAVDASSGRVVRRVTVANPYPILLARGGGAVWVGSVENGFVAGAVTRIGGSGRVSTPLVLPRAPVLDLAVGGGSAWVLVGPWRRAQLVAIDLATRRTRTVALPRRPLALAGDGENAVAGTASGRLFRLTGAGAIPLRSFGKGAVPVAVGLGVAWIQHASELAIVDLSSGRTRTIARAVYADLAFGRGWGYAVRYRPAGPEIVRFDPDGGRVLARRRVLRGASQIAYGAGAVWVGVAGGSDELLRLDPLTLAVRARTALR